MLSHSNLSKASPPNQDALRNSSAVGRRGKNSFLSAVDVKQEVDDVTADLLKLDSLSYLCREQDNNLGHAIEPGNCPTEIVFGLLDCCCCCC